jgi:glutaredoxin 2
MKLYSYDHCPFCVKARMIFGFKALPFELITLLNDDEETPIRMIGQKMVPILEKEDGSWMPESMDIVRYVDGTYGQPVLEATPANEPLNEWLAASRSYVYRLAMPRWVDAPLEEFATEGARTYFTRKKEASIGSFAEHLANSPALIAQADAHLRELDGILQSETAVNGLPSEDDIHLYATLRSLSIVKGITYPTRIRAYMEAMAASSKVPLHLEMAR